MQLTPEFKACLHEIETAQKPLYITGRAGTGKSTLLRAYCAQTSKKVVVLAPTGIAALHVGGQTIHSFFGFPPRPLQAKDFKPRRNKKLYQSIEVLIIDEVSMVRADLLDGIDQFMRQNGRDARLPFGGVRVVLFGDLFQLPPVVASPEEAQLFHSFYSSPFFFAAKVFQKTQLQMFELTQVFRQKNRGFIRLLDAVRLNHAEYDELEQLNTRHGLTPDPDLPYITLSARNAQVDALNAKRLAELPTESFSFLARITGDFRSLPAATPLELKLGAQVMFLRNDTQRRFVNGSIGVIHDIDHDKIIVELVQPSGRVIYVPVERHTWEMLRYIVTPSGKLQTKVIGTFEQYPLRLAWAMTIHKSQGKTFERVVLDMPRGAFAAGQTYVALSRCTSLDGLILKQPLQPRDIQVDPRVVEFYEQAIQG